MAINRKAINYTVYPPNFDSDRDASWDVRTASKARLLAKRLGIGSRLRRNINVVNKPSPVVDWWVEKVFEWNGSEFRNITNDASKGPP